ncbi:PAP2 superfamily protein [Kineococcus xinjiangensis]|uniref:PAP2 superfamily protein n=1 Tax=Kineococcus xinjiangensis TaxID=512762 RepID=A0A2S6IHZ9_9ACTN|nr:vanadium-dependent haloperoxidase [Kineococcus xinjiangensis]PPK93800.1 PAP2 superfamily protein [Kineococcus xinjiangensis]
MLDAVRSAGGASRSRRGFLGAAVTTGSGILLAPPATAATQAPGRGASFTGDHGPEVAATWLRALYQVTATEGLTPPAAARAYAYCTVAMYEAVVPGMPGFRSTGRQLNGLHRLPQPAHRSRLDWPTALSAAVSAAAAGVHGAASVASQEILRRTHEEQVAARRAAGVTEGDLRHSLAFGHGIGAAVAQWAATDGAAEAAALPYTPPVGESFWVPTPPNFGTAVEPHCALVRPMVLRTADEVAPEPPVPFSTEPGSPFWQQAMVPYQQSAVNTDETRDIARFWTDNPRFSGMPAGHWLNIAVQACEQHGLGLDRTVEALARTGIALHDAFLNCWTWKYRHNLVRPVTYVRRHIDPTWTTWVNSPQFPEHTSGHSVGSRAASTVLTALLGSLAFDDTSLATTVGIGKRTRSYRSFHEAADTAAQSRIYGGIHYPHGVDAGKAQGDAVGALVVARLRTDR